MDREAETQRLKAALKKKDKDKEAEERAEERTKALGDLLQLPLEAH